MGKNRPSSDRGLSIALLVLLSFVILLTVFLSAPVLNVFYQYSLPGGAFYNKFHPTTFACILIVILLLIKGDILLPNKTVTVAAIVTLLAAIAQMALSGRWSIVSTYIDTHLVAVILTISLINIDIKLYHKLIRLTIISICVGSIFVFVEYFTKERLISGAIQDYFRPVGLWGNPITSALVMNCGLLIASSNVIGVAWRRVIIIYLSAAIAVSGVRGGLIICSLILLNYMYKNCSSRNDKLFNIFIVILACFSVIYGINIGVFDRIINAGVWDESAQTRFAIFNIFNIMPEYYWWGGTQDYDLIEWYAVNATGVRFVENILVLTILQTGIVATLFVTTFFITWYGRMMLTSSLYFLILPIVLVTSITFATKNALPVVFAVSSSILYRRSIYKEQI